MSLNKVLSRGYTFYKNIKNTEHGNKLLSSTLHDIIPTINKRINRLNKNEMRTPALRQWEEYIGSGKITYGHLSFRQRKFLLYHAIQFLQAETSTIKGANNYYNKILKTLNAHTDLQYIPKADKSQFLKDVFNIYDEIQAYGGDIEYKYDRDLLDSIIDMEKNTFLTKEQIVDILKNKKQNIYEQNIDDEPIIFRWKND